MSLFGGNPFPDMADIVRPWVDVISYSTPRTLPPPAEVLPEAFLRWGGPSQFNFSDSFRDKANNPFGFHTKDEPNDENVVYQFTETGRNTSQVRVENPDDPDQFVIVEQINAIEFSGPKGVVYSFRFANPS